MARVPELEDAVLLTRRADIHREEKRVDSLSPRLAGPASFEGWAFLGPRAVTVAWDT